MPKIVIVWKIFELAKALYPEITRMWYSLDKESGEEYVFVEYKTKPNYGAGIGPQITGGSFRINVTADSNVALVNDVLKKLERNWN